MQQTEIFCPATGESLGVSPLHTREDLVQKIADSRKAQQQWRSLSVKQRARQLRPIADYLVKNRDALAKLISQENGKLPIEALATEVVPSILGTHYYCKKAPSILKSRAVAPAAWVLAYYRTKMRYVPFGVVGIISPWNYPFSIAFVEVLCALLAGNGVILKTATQTQLVGLELARAVESADLPQGLFQFINLPGKIAGDAFLENGVDKLFFTGSVPVGKYLMAKAAETLTPVSLELGGNDAMIVCEDADLELAANGVLWAGLSNAGQSCGGIERIYVHENAYQRFLDILKPKVENLKIGSWQDEWADLGVMTTQGQVDTVQAHLKDALQKGATLLAQSDFSESPLRNTSNAYVLTNVTHDMDLMKHETFGPLVGIMPFENNEQAIDFANDSYLGLTASVWSRKIKTAEKLASRIHAGTISINEHLMSHGLQEASWGGFKQSGIGRTHGRLGLLEMVEPQHIVKDILPGVKRKLWWHPYTKGLYNGLNGLIDFLYAGFGKKIIGLARLLTILPRMWKK